MTSRKLALLETSQRQISRLLDMLAEANELADEWQAKYEMLAEGIKWDGDTARMPKEVHVEVSPGRQEIISPTWDDGGAPIAEDIREIAKADDEMIRKRGGTVTELNEVLESDALAHQIGETVSSPSENEPQKNAVTFTGPMDVSEEAVRMITKQGVELEEQRGQIDRLRQALNVATNGQANLDEIQFAVKAEPPIIDPQEDFIPPPTHADSRDDAIVDAIDNQDRIMLRDPESGELKDATESLIR